jgi:hypothetical protein
MSWLWLPIVGVICFLLGGVIGAGWMVIALSADELPRPHP